MPLSRLYQRSTRYCDKLASCAAARASMGNEIEHNFIKRFVDKRLRDRMILELDTPHEIVVKNGKENEYMSRRRDRAIYRLDNPRKIISDKYIYLEEKYLSEQDAEKIVRSLDKVYDKAHFMCHDGADGEDMPLHKGISVLYNNYGTTVLVCGENTALIKEEASYGTPTKYILFRKPGE